MEDTSKDLSRDGQVQRLTPDEWVEHLNKQDQEKLREECERIDRVIGNFPDQAEKQKEEARIDCEVRIRDRNREHLNSKLQPVQDVQAQIQEEDLSILRSLTEALVSLTRVLNKIADKE